MSKLFFIYIVLASQLLSCKHAPINYEPKNLDQKILVLGHRGMGEFNALPDNSKESVLKVLSIGADGSEIDLQLTKDGHLVLFHHEELNSKTNCKGKIYEMNLDEVIQCKFNGINTNYHIISFSDLLNELQNPKNYIFSLDIKEPKSLANRTEYFEKLSLAINTICASYQYENNILLEGNEKFHNALNLNYNIKKVFTGALFHQSVAAAQKYDAFAVGTSNNATSLEEIQDAQQKGIYTVMWGAKSSKSNIEVIQKHCDIIQTDKPEHLLKQLNKYNTEPITP